jgi:hypothetical protein
MISDSAESMEVPVFAPALAVCTSVSSSMASRLEQGELRGGRWPLGRVAMRTGSA